ncbi:MAG: hypothetical protein ABH869_05725 [Candidatus Omnitrophota bacterium]
MSIVDAIKKGFAHTNKLLKIVVLFFGFNTAIGLISLPLANPARTGNPMIIVLSVISSIVFFLIFIFLQGGALGLVKDQIKTASNDMSQFIGYGKKYYVRILSLLLLYVLIAIAVVLILGLISTGVLLLGDNIITRSLVATVVTVAAVMIITMLIYPIYAIVVDEANALEAFKKGISISKKNFWRTLGLFLATLLVSLVISLIIGFLAGIVSIPLNADISQVLIAIINAGVQSYIPIVMMVAFMNFYMELTGGEATAQAGK